MATPRKRNKYQVVLVTVLNATAAGTLIEGLVRPDPDYGFVNGVAVSIGNPGSIQGGSYVDVGLRDSTGFIHDDCHMENWQANAGVSPKQKFKDILVPCDGRNIFARVTTNTLSTAQYQIQFIFRLVDTLEVIARV